MQHKEQEVAISDYSWTGPKVLAHIDGVVDDIDMTPSDFKRPDGSTKMQTQLTIVDVVQTYEDESTQELPSRTLYVPEEGKNAQVFSSTLKKCLGLGPKDAITGDMIRGAAISVGVHTETFTIKATGEQGQMTIYSVDKVETNGVAGVAPSDEDVVEALLGKTPAQALQLRGNYKGTKFAQVLGSRRLTEEYFAGKVAVGDNGTYARTD